MKSKRQDALNRIDKLAGQAQEHLAALTADVIGRYLCEYTIQMEMERLANSDTKLSDLSDILRYGGFISPTKDLAYNQNVTDALEQLSASPTKRNAQHLTKTLYDEGITKDISRMISPNVLEGHRIVRALYVQKLNEYEEAVLKARDKPDLSKQQQDNIDLFLGDFQAFRDGISAFPRMTADIAPILPHFTGLEHIPEHPFVQFLDRLNDRVYQKRFVLNPDDAIQNKSNTIACMQESGKKSRTRIEQKAENEKDGDYSRITDAARTNIVVDDFSSMERLSELLVDLSQARGYSPDPKGLDMNVRGAWKNKTLVTIPLGDGQKLTTEVQMNDEHMNAVGKYSHKVYTLIRTYSTHAKVNDRMSNGEFKAFVERYNQVIGRLDGRQNGIFARIREADPERLQQISEHMKPFDVETLSRTIGRDDEAINDNSRDTMQTMIDNLVELNQVVHSFAAISRSNPEHHGMAHPSMAAAFAVLADRMNEKIPEQFTDKRIDTSLIPQEGKDFDAATYKQTAQQIDHINGLGKERGR